MPGKRLPTIVEGLPNNRIPVLVVDDSLDNLDLMEALLIAEGFETIYRAASGPEAFAVLGEKSEVGVVLLDMMMPGMDGHEVCRRITSSEEWGHIPVIIITGGALRHNEALQKSFAAGAIDFATKPVNEVELVARVHSALSLYRERVMRQEKTRALSESEQKFRITFAEAPIGIAHVSLDGKLILVNDSLAKMLGYSSEEMINLDFRVLCDGYWSSHQEHLSAMAAGASDHYEYDLPLNHKQGSKVWTHTIIAPLWEADGQIKYFIHVIDNINERKAIEEKLQLAATVFDNSAEAIIITDANGDILSVNHAFTAITGFTSEEAVGQNPRILSAKIQDKKFYEEMWATVKTVGHWQGEIWNRRKSGDIYPTWLTLSSVRNSSSEITNYVGISRDITVRKEAEQRLAYLANHDALTGLPNRILFNDRLNHALAHSKRYKNSLAILFLDLDRFKVINDTLGHDLGDMLLQSVAQRVSKSLRSSDTVARWGGDEFTILADELNSPQDAVTVARRVLEVLTEPFVLSGHEIFVTGSIGITLFPKDGEDAQTLLSNADAAMYRAKEKGKNGYQFYTAAMNASALERLRLESDLRRALEREEFFLHYQPKVDIKTGQIVGVEALIRWSHPTLGMVSPQQFIPLAEETGLIIPIGDWVLRTACTQNQAWYSAGICSVRVAVNISAEQFRKENLTETVTRILGETRLPHDLLELEITESVMMQDLDRAIAVMTELSARGIRFSIDDFGTGYSSLVYLKRLPIDILKIDRSLVSQMPEDPDDTAIAAAIISMGKSLNLQVIAEGVETEQQLAFLLQQGCDEAQGFLFSRPVAADKMTELLEKKMPLWDGTR